MSHQLTRTLLSTRPKGASAWLGLFSVLLFALVFYWDPRNSAGVSLLSASGRQVFAERQYWRVFTTTFVHANLEHLFANSYGFAGFAFLLNSYFGFTAFPVLSVLAGAIINLVVLSIYDPGATLVGASGVVYFMAALWLTLYCCIERGKPYSGRLANAFAFASILLVPSAFEPHVSYLAHAVGFALGVPTGLIFFKARQQELRSFEVWQERAPDFDFNNGYEWPLEFAPQESRVPGSAPGTSDQQQQQ